VKAANRPGECKADPNVKNRFLHHHLGRQQNERGLLKLGGYFVEARQRTFDINPASSRPHVPLFYSQCARKVLEKKKQLRRTHPREAFNIIRTRGLLAVGIGFPAAQAVYLKSNDLIVFETPDKRRGNPHWEPNGAYRDKSRFDKDGRSAGRRPGKSNFTT